MNAAIHKAKTIYIVVVVILMLANCGQEDNKPNSTVESEVEHVTFPAPTYHPDWFKHSFFDLSDDVQEANELGKRLIIYFYQDGCPYCKKLIEHNLGQIEISDYAKKHFEVVAMNIFGSVDVTDIDGEVLSEKEFSKKIKVNFTPTMVTYNEEGNIIFRMNGYYAPDKFMAMLKYLSEKQENNIKFLDFLDFYQSEHKPSILDIGKFDENFQVTPLDLEETMQSNSKPLAVFFEEENCVVCDELHNDILQRKETKKYLKEFNLAVIDIHSEEPIVAPGGEKLKSKDWALSKEIQFIPTILFFDNAGAEVFRIDGYVKAFHLQSSFDYVLTGSYKEYPGFQPFLHDRADKLEEEGIEIEIMK